MECVTRSGYSSRYPVYIRCIPHSRKIRSAQVESYNENRKDEGTPCTASTASLTFHSIARDAIFLFCSQIIKEQSTGFQPADSDLRGSYQVSAAKVPSPKWHP